MCSSILACLRMLVSCVMLPAVAATVLLNYRIGHKVLVYIPMHCTHFCSAQTHHMEDTVTPLSGLVCSIFTCAAGAVIIETVVHVGKARAKL